MRRTEPMDQHCDLADLVGGSKPMPLRQVIAEIKATYGVSETGAYAIFVRAAAGLPTKLEDQLEPRSRHLSLVAS